MSDLVPTTMHDYYLSQPAYLKQILDDRRKLIEPFGKFYASNKPDRIYLFGSGSSLNACKAAEAFISHILDTEVTCAVPSNPPVICGRRPLIVAVSQGGRSSNTVAYLQSLQQDNRLVASFTANLDGPVAELADIAVVIGVGDETVGPKTRGYTGTVLCLYLAALEAGLASGVLSISEYDRHIGLLSETIGYAKENQERCLEFYHSHLENLKSATHYLFVGKGCAAAVGEESAIKVLETLCFPSSGYEFEEYLHGPVCSTNEQTALFLFYSGDKDGPRMEKLAAITAKASKNCYIVDRTSSLTGNHILRLSAGNCKYMSPFVDIFIGQLISALLPGELGRTRHEAVKEIFSDMNTKIVR